VILPIHRGVSRQQACFKFHNTSIQPIDFIGGGFYCFGVVGIWHERAIRLRALVLIIVYRTAKKAALLNLAAPQFEEGGLLLWLINPPIAIVVPGKLAWQR